MPPFTVLYYCQRSGRWHEEQADPPTFAAAVQYARQVAAYRQRPVTIRDGQNRLYNV
jgi:hypothetical protein